MINLPIIALTKWTSRPINSLVIIAHLLKLHKVLNEISSSNLSINAMYYKVYSINMFHHEEGSANN
jgi:hypothetical protein